MRTKPGQELPLRPDYRKPRMLCVCGCGKVGPITGRGLRGECYGRETRAGTLDKWPKLTRGKAPGVSDASDRSDGSDRSEVQAPFAATRAQEL